MPYPYLGGRETVPDRPLAQGKKIPKQYRKRNNKNEEVTTKYYRQPAIIELLLLFFLIWKRKGSFTANLNSPIVQNVVFLLTNFLPLIKFFF